MELGVHYIDFLPGTPEQLGPTMAAAAKAAEQAGEACSRWPITSSNGVHGLSRRGFEPLNSGPFPGNPDPVGWIKRLGDEVIPRLPS